MMYFFLSLMLSLGVILMGLLISKKTILDKEKTSPFECGFDPFFVTRMPFSLRFFKIAIIFLIFDIEIAILLPLPLSSSMVTFELLNTTSIILFIVLYGLFYEWMMGALNWVK